MWISESESAWFWMSVFRNTTGQLCIVHQIRNSCKFVVWKDKKEFSRDLKCIYIANNLEQAVDALDTLEDKWGNKYYYAIKSWRDK